MVDHKARILTRPLKDYASAAEIIGAIAVVISLIYVGLSVNQNTNAVMVANHQALIAMDQNTNGWFRDPEFAATFENAMEDASELSPVQLLQYHIFLADGRTQMQPLAKPYSGFVRQRVDRLQVHRAIVEN